jgi:hypothetical protein
MNDLKILTPKMTTSSNRAIWADRLDIANKVGSFVDQNGNAFSPEELRGIVAEFDSVLDHEAATTSFAGLTASEPTPYFN